jgi:hypothetical protein
MQNALTPPATVLRALRAYRRTISCPCDNSRVSPAAASADLKLVQLAISSDTGIHPGRPMLLAWTCDSLRRNGTAFRRL